jgi:hypothetical protein
VPLLAANSPLVNGGTAEPTMATPAKTTKVRAVRAFLIQGKRVDPGKEIEVSRNLALELVSTNKAELVPDAPAKAAAKQPPKED